MKTIAWYSQHKPLPRQEARLRKLFGADVVIIQDPRPFSSAESVVARYREAKVDEMVVVAPLSVIDHICRQGIRPLWAEMIQQDTSEGADLTFRGRHYRFTRFRRIKELRLEFIDPEIDDGTE